VLLLLCVAYSTSAKDDELVSSALGYTVHVLMLCSKYLKVGIYSIASSEIYVYYMYIIYVRFVNIILIICIGHTHCLTNYDLYIFLYVLIYYFDACD
jgi:hypothetical protein